MGNESWVHHPPSTSDGDATALRWAAVLRSGWLIKRGLILTCRSTYVCCADHLEGSTPRPKPQQGVKRSFRAWATGRASSGVLVGSPAPSRARVSLVVRPGLLAIRPGLGFAAPVSFGLPTPAVLLTLAALLAAVGFLPRSF